jgi:hypothetical protein
MKSVTKVLSVLTLSFLLFVVSAFAQGDTTVAGWKKSLVVDLTTTQTAYSDSWTGGEAGSFNWVGNLNGKAEKQLKEWLDVQSRLKLSFGQTVTQNPDTKGWSKPRKSTDLIDWETIGLITVDAYVDPYVAFRLESQFLNASVDAKNRYLDPILLTESGGAARKVYQREDDEILLRLGLAVRQRINKVIVDTATLATDDSVRTDGGFQFNANANLTLSEKLSYTGQLTLYKAVIYSDKDELKGTPFEDDWKAIDVNWETIITASVSKIITVNLYTQLLYDKQISRRGRIKETLGLGFVFKLI